MPMRGVIIGAVGAAAVIGVVGAAYYAGHRTEQPAPQTNQTDQTAANQTPPADQTAANQTGSEQQGTYSTPQGAQGGYDRGGYDHGRYDRGRYDQGGYGQGAYDQGGYDSQPWPNDNRPHHARRVDFRYFHDQLAPYGRWEYDDRWGEVWQPTAVHAGFHPYQDGHWTYTDEFGWTWVSDYGWGDIAFHYGRWVDDPDRGWLWVPGYVWGPGWVVWRQGAGHAGWMPMPPDRAFLSNDESYRGDWSGEANNDYGYRGWYGDRFDQNRADSMWVYVDLGHLADPDYRRYAVTQPDQVRQLNAQTQNVTHFTTTSNYVVDRSIDPQAVAQKTGHPVRAVAAQVALRDPQLVAPVTVGHQVAAQTRQEIPAGQGKPHSAPPPKAEALHAAVTPAPASPATAPAPASSPVQAGTPAMRTEQRPAPRNVIHNGPPAQTTNIPAPPSAPQESANRPAPAQPAEQTSVARHEHQPVATPNTASGTAAAQHNAKSNPATAAAENPRSEPQVNHPSAAAANPSVGAANPKAQAQRTEPANGIGTAAPGAEKAEVHANPPKDHAAKPSRQAAGHRKHKPGERDQENPPGP